MYSICMYIFFNAGSTVYSLKCNVITVEMVPIDVNCFLKTMRISIKNMNFLKDFKNEKSSHPPLSLIARKTSNLYYEWNVKGK
jgi:hypothetical protein